jgi:hypothetical protein
LANEKIVLRRSFEALSRVEGTNTEQLGLFRKKEER